MQPDDDNPRALLLYDAAAAAPSWNERLSAGEYAILYSHALPFEGMAAGEPYCTVHASLEDAESYARALLVKHPELRCRIYDHHGLGAAPVREMRGGEHKGEPEMSAQFRRYAGLVLVLGGLGLAGFDWQAGFRYGWPSMVGMRLLPTGLVLLAIELGYRLNAMQNSRAPGRTSSKAQRGS